MIYIRFIRDTRYFFIKSCKSNYRVRSKQGTEFRIWSTKTLKEFIIKGFVLDDVRLKNGKHFGKDYFDELLEHIRETRASERRFYQKITDIYSQCSVDYDARGDISKRFYATVQNKPNMRLTTWKHTPDCKVTKLDVTVAKNYSNEKEISELNRLVNMHLDNAELQASRGVPMKMKDWVEKLDGFLKFNEYEVLKNAGKISTEVAKEIAEGKYKKFRVEQLSIRF